MNTTRKPYPSDVADTEWEFLLPHLTLMREDAPQRSNDLREVYDALRDVVKTGCQWRQMPHDLPDWTVVYQQALRWFQAGVFEDVAHDLRVILRLVNDRESVRQVEVEAAGGPEADDPHAAELSREGARLLCPRRVCELL